LPDCPDFEDLDAAAAEIPPGADGLGLGQPAEIVPAWARFGTPANPNPRGYGTGFAGFS